MDRKRFITITAGVMGAIPFSGFNSGKGTYKPVRFGVVTDIHYADRAAQVSLNRYYSESLAKLSECVDVMNDQKVDFLIELGDFKDQGAVPDEKETLVFLDRIEKAFSLFKGPRYHVLGNHDHDSISKQQFLDGISNEGFSPASNFYSFNKNSFHFIVLDANYTSAGIPYDHGNFDWRDAFIPGKQLEWLKSDLDGNKMPVVIFIHHRLDSHRADKIYCPVNADAVRKILEEDGKVMLVVQGHHHVGDISKLNGITYYTLKAVVEGSGMENNNYAIVEIDRDARIRISGFRKTGSQDLY